MSRLRKSVFVVAVAGMLGILSFVHAEEAKPVLSEQKLSAPVTHDNLTIFFIHGKNLVKGKLLTLEEALKEKKVIVHETKNVNELAIENVSTDDVFVQAGDIVKGGQQDRTIALDMIVPGKSGRVPLSSFCVESGRWSRRAGEDAGAFNGSPYALANKELKLAARAGKSQGEVWRQVAQTQQKLAMVLKSEVKDSRSATSLQLTLENKRLLDAMKGYINKMEKALPEKSTDVIGYAMAINGKVISADVYANADLFKKLWPKLVRAGAVEAFSEVKKDLKYEPVKADAVNTFFNEVAKGKRTERKLNLGQKEVQLDTKKNVLFETQSEKGAVIRRSYIAK